VDNIHGDILFFENNGRPRAGHPWHCRYLAGPETNISRAPLVGSMPHAYDVAIADLDGDGRLDLAATGWVGNTVAWFRNTTAGWDKHVIEQNIAEPRTIRTADFNGNGSPDLLATATAEGEVIWYENPGNPAEQPWRKHVIATELRPTHGHPVDMTGNGRIDVVMACGFADKTNNFTRHQVVWYENTGDPDQDTWPRHVIANELPHAFEGVAADIDGDGRPEVVATGWGENGQLVVCRPADSDPRGPWNVQVLKNDWPRANQVVLADLTGDGRPDIVACAERGSNELRWWRNLGE